jgi:AcrR family transcriptional regulator
MDDDEFDAALIASAFRLTADQGWRRVNVAAAARAANLPLDRVRARFPAKIAVLLRFGRLADQQALKEAPGEGPPRDRLFDLVMRRFDALQAHRAGVLALMRVLPADPALAAILTCATRRSMRWMLEASGIGTQGIRGEIRVRGLVGIWLWTLRAWQRDESPDLSATMAALDDALRRAERFASWLGNGHAPRRPEPAGETEEPAGPLPEVPPAQA